MKKIFKTNKLRFLKKLSIFTYVIFVLSMGITYAAITSGQLVTNGQIFVVEFDENSAVLPVLPVQINGVYFNFVQQPSQAIERLGENWPKPDIFVLYLKKPATISNQGNQSFSVAFQYDNPSAFNWIAGSYAETGVYLGDWNNKTLVTSGNPMTSVTPTVNKGQRGTFTMAFATKISAATFDRITAEIRYTLITTAGTQVGPQKHLYLDFWFVPFYGYFIQFDGNGATGGSMPDPTDVASGKRCIGGTNCGIGQNGFTKTSSSFQGWALEADGAVVYANNANINYAATNVASLPMIKGMPTLVLYAKWS